jgi:Flp pilus assembly protein TadG
MKTLTSRSARRTRGSVAVETAIILPIMALLISGLVWFAQVFWYYSVLQKAAYDAARLLSTATPVEITTLGPNNMAPIAQLVHAITTERTSVTDKVKEKLLIDVQCDFSTCGLAVPSTVRVAIRMTMPFPIIENNSLMLTSDVTMRYAGN